MEDNNIVGFEALSRLHSSSLNNITPDEFIPIAENNQLIIPLGNHVLENACKFLSLLSKAGFKDTKVTINVSAIELFQKDYVDRILKRLKYYNLESSRLTIEITESVLFSDFDYINRKLRQLQAYGIRVALDDFGTGYSSFDRMDSLNINVLKIDRYFVDKITKRRKNEVIISDIISMAHKFGLSVVAEGVENNEQFKYLQQHNCDMMQGYYFSKALKSKDALILVRNWSKSQTINSTHK
jgi:EAL domain-containing protein (putative c-di-GMP-specific phosphodiesterase class I)